VETGGIPFQTNLGSGETLLCYELEALSLVVMTKHFSYYLYGRQFTAFTDHKALCSFLSTVPENKRLRRLAMQIQPLMVSIAYKPGPENVFSDALSRVPQLVLGE